MAVSVDKTWINKAIAEFNRSRDKNLDRLTDEIIRHGMFDSMKRSLLMTHLEMSQDERGFIQTNATEIYDMFASQPAGKTLKLSGNMRVLDIDRETGRVPDPEEVVEKLLEDDEPGYTNDELQALWSNDQATEKFLNDNGVKCSYEYPGYFSCPCKLGDLNVGTADGFWGADIDSNGYNVGIPADAFEGFIKLENREPEDVSREELLTAIKQVLAWANQ